MLEELEMHVSYVFADLHHQDDNGYDLTRCPFGMVYSIVFFPSLRLLVTGIFFLFVEVLLHCIG